MSSGKLKRLSAPIAIHRPKVRTAVEPMKRTLARNVVRPDVYEAVGESPERAPHLEQRQVDHAPEFSPRRSQRRAMMGERSTSSRANGRLNMSSAGRNQEKSTQATRPTKSRKSEPAVKSHAAREIDGEDTIVYGDRFPDTMVHKYQQGFAQKELSYSRRVVLGTGAERPQDESPQRRSKRLIAHSPEKRKAAQPISGDERDDKSNELHGTGQPDQQNIAKRRRLDEPNGMQRRNQAIPPQVDATLLEDQESDRVGGENDQGQAHQQPRNRGSQDMDAGLVDVALNRRSSTPLDPGLTQPSDADEHTSQQLDKGVDLADKERLCGQWLNLQKIFRAVRMVGCRSTNNERQTQDLPDLTDEEVRKAVRLCRHAIKRFRELGQGQDGEEPAELLAKIQEQVQLLRQPEFFNGKDDAKITNIYSHLLPSLVRLLWYAVACYEELDRGQSYHGGLSHDHLIAIWDLTTLVTTLGDTARRSYKTRPDTAYCITKPTYNGLVVPLRHIRKNLGLHLEAERRRIQAAEQQQRARTERELRQRREEIEQEQRERFEVLEKKWANLHWLRRRAEGLLVPRATQERLALPNNQLDIDQNGAPFYRVEVFHPRVGPPPYLAEQARMIEWEKYEVAALARALEKFAGPTVYEKTICEFCPRGKALNRFTVTQIVTKAALLKEHIQRVWEENSPEWVTSLFIWTNLHVGAGQENS